MRGSTPGFWKKYERQQFAMATACMPRTSTRNVLDNPEPKLPSKVIVFGSQSVPARSL